MFIPAINPDGLARRTRINSQTPGSFGSYFGKEQNIFVITLEPSSEDGYVALQENKNGILEVIKYFKSKRV